MATSRQAAKPLPPKPAPATKKAAKPKRARPALKMPRTLAGCADLLYSTKDERLAEQRKVNEIAEDEKAIKNHLIEQLPKGEASGVSGKLARATIVRAPVAQIKDADRLWAAIKKNPAKWGHLVAPPAISAEALQEIVELGGRPEEIQKRLPPGVSVFNIIKVSLNKVG